MKITDRDVAKKFNQLIDSAEARNIPFNLSFATVRRLMTVKTCYFTKIPFNDKGNGEFPDSRTFDRLDNAKGYVEKNVVACVKKINSLKANLSLEDIKAIYTGVKHLL